MRLFRRDPWFGEGSVLKRELRKHSIIAVRQSRIAFLPEATSKMSQEELGHIVGASRQRISQALQVLEKAGLINVDYRMITVLDIEGLRRFGA